MDLAHYSRASVSGEPAWVVWVALCGPDTCAQAVVQEASRAGANLGTCRPIVTRAKGTVSQPSLACEASVSASSLGHAGLYWRH